MFYFVIKHVLHKRVDNIYILYYNVVVDACIVENCFIVTQYHDFCEFIFLPGISHINIYCLIISLTFGTESGYVRS